MLLCSLNKIKVGLVMEFVEFLASTYKVSEGGHLRVDAHLFEQAPIIMIQGEIAVHVISRGILF